MRRLLTIAFLFAALPVFGGGQGKIQVGSGGGNASIIAGAGGGTMRISLGLSEPTNLAFTSASSNTIAASWTGSGLTPPASNYTLTLSTNSNFSAPTVSSSTPGTTATLSGLSVNRVYYGRVLATSNDFNPSPYSGVRSTATLATTPVTVVSTWTGVTSSGLTVNWGAGDNPSGITNYICQLSTVSGFGSGTTLSSATSNTSAGFTGLSGGTTYYGQVQAVNPNNIATTFFNAGSTVTVTSTAIILLTASTATAQSANPITWSHTVPAGNNRAIIVVCNLTSGGTANTISGITFNTSENFSSAFSDSGGPGELVSIWYLQAPTVTTANIAATYTGTGGAADFAVCTGINFQNILQVGNPVDATASAHPLGTNPSTNISVVTNGAWIVDGLESDTTTVATATSPQIAQSSLAKPTQFASSGVSVKGPMAPGTQSMGWNNGANDCMHVLAAFKPN